MVLIVIKHDALNGYVDLLRLADSSSLWLCMQLAKLEGRVPRLAKALIGILSFRLSERAQFSFRFFLSKYSRSTEVIENYRELFLGLVRLP